MHALTSLRFSLLASAAFTLPLAALAQDAGEIYTLDEIVVSGSLTPVAKSETGATVETVDADETGDASTPVLDVLTTLPGVSYSSNGGLGTSSNLRIRGLDARYVGVRINGIDVSDPSSGQAQFDFGGLTGFGISSIEVVKGSQSALYGSEAVAGLIDIRTDGAVEPGYDTTVELSGGSYGTYSGGISSVLESDTGKLSFSLSHVKTDGFSALASNDEDDGYEATTLTFGLEQDVSDSVTLGLSGLYMSSDNDYDLSSDIGAQSSREQKGLRSFARIQGDTISHEFSASLFETDRSYPGGYTEDYTGKRHEFAYLGSTDLSALSTLTFGFEYTEEKFNIDGLARKDDNKAVKAEWLHSPMDTLDLSVALRYDDHSDFGDHLSGRLAAAWDVAPDWTLRAVLGTGFRAPSLYERYSPSGKADLKEETSQSAEIGIERRFGGDDFVKGTLFYTKIDDRIDYDFVTSTYNQVPGTTTSKGIELSGHYTLSERVALFGNYTYTDAETAGEKAQRVPRHDLVLGLDALLTDQLSGQFTVQHVADVTPSPYAPADHRVGDYTLVNAGLSYQLNDATALSLRIENLTDEDYETAGGYNTPGRSAYLGLKASF